jgi:thymidylate synthase (FAD)
MSENTHQTKRPTVAAAEEILGMYFPVLNHGFVALVDYMGGDADIEQAARVAYGHGTRQTSQTRGLIRYLHRHRHTSPSEMVELKFHCSMPIFVARQWIRHRTANVNEMSGRYSILPMQFYMPTDDQLRQQSATNKQGRQAEDTLSPEKKEQAYNWWRGNREGVAQQYQWLNENDFARELARIDLPVSTYTQWYWKIDLHNLLHFLTLRVDAHAQWEIQQFGIVMAGMLKRVAPLSFEAWIDYDVMGARLSRTELDIVRQFIGKNSTEGLMALPGVEDAFQSKTLLTQTGLAEREAEEFAGLFSSFNMRDVPSFDLDLSQAKSGEFFAERAKLAAPGGK